MNEDRKLDYQNRDLKGWKTKKQRYTYLTDKIKEILNRIGWDAPISEIIKGGEFKEEEKEVITATVSNQRRENNKIKQPHRRLVLRNAG